MAQSLSTSQVGLAVPQDDMELGSDVERGSDLVIDTDIQIDVDVDLTNDPIEFQDDDYILEDVRSDAEHRSEWQTDQVDDDLMQDEERDGLSMADDATILDAEHEDVDLTQDLDNGVSLNVTSGDLAQANTTAEYPDEVPSQPVTEAVHGSVMNSPTINHQIEATQESTASGHHTGPTQETSIAVQEPSTSKDNLESARPSSETSNELSVSVAHEPGINPSLSPTADDNGQHAELVKEAQFEDPEYDEDPDYEEYTSSPQDHGLLLHPITVLYQETEMSLFPPTVDDAAETYFLQDESLADLSISELFKAMRLVLADTVSDDDELELGMDVLDLYLTEGSIYTQQTTLSQILDLYLKLSQHDGVENPDPLYITLTTRASCVKRMKELSAAVEEGKGISQLSLWDDDNPKTADDQPIMNDDDGATAIQRPQERSALEETLDEEAGGAEYAQDGSPPAGGRGNSEIIEEHVLATASDNLAKEQSKPEHLLATSSPHSTPDQGVSLNSTLPVNSADNDLGDYTNQRDLPEEAAKDEARPEADEDLITYEEDEKGPTGQSDIYRLSTQTGDDYDDNDDGNSQDSIIICLMPERCFCPDCDRSAVTKPSLEGESKSEQAPLTDPARETANKTTIDFIEDHSTTTGDVAPQANHETVDVEFQYEDSLAKEDLEDGLCVDEDGLQTSVALDEGSAEGKLGPETDNTESWVQDDTYPTSQLLESNAVESIGDGINNEPGAQDGLTYDDGSEFPQPVNYEDQDELELDYNWAEGDDQFLDHTTIPYTEEGENIPMTQNELATDVSGAGWVGPKAGSEDSTTEVGDVQDYQWNTENVTSSQNEFDREFHNDDWSSSSSIKRSRVDNDETELQQNNGQGPKRVRSK